MHCTLRQWNVINRTATLAVFRTAMRHPSCRAPPRRLLCHDVSGHALLDLIWLEKEIGERQEVRNMATEHRKPPGIGKGERSRVTR